MINLSLICHDKFVIIGIGGGYGGGGMGGGWEGGSKKCQKKTKFTKN